ncbi:EB domain-containing protein [Caerostris extrusa]|uniref:EB domain-containing protein n=1 Tax=Caerostris extrusa TaxID=172846 RepID=A0AAV4RHZ8_CAEEX|nr:EB domain-containing protein [Caerostris extrusa]
MKTLIEFVYGYVYTRERMSKKRILKNELNNVLEGTWNQRHLTTRKPFEVGHRIRLLMERSVLIHKMLRHAARFRNRRTIFNSPHPRLMHIKLGKRKSPASESSTSPTPGQFMPRHQLLGTPLSLSRRKSVQDPQPRMPAVGAEPGVFAQVRSTAPGRRPSRRGSHCLLARTWTRSIRWKPSLDVSFPSLQTPEPLQNGGLPSRLSEEECHPQAPGSPTVIITDADGAHTVVTSSRPPRDRRRSTSEVIPLIHRSPSCLASSYSAAFRLEREAKHTPLVVCKELSIVQGASSSIWVNRLAAIRI